MFISRGEQPFNTALHRVRTQQKFQHFDTFGTRRSSCADMKHILVALKDSIFCPTSLRLIFYSVQVTLAEPLMQLRVRENHGNQIAAERL